MPVIHYLSPYRHNSSYGTATDVTGGLAPYSSDIASEGLRWKNINMSKRTGEIISKIYRHPVEGRQVLTASIAEAEALPLLPGVAVISIVAPGRSPANLPAYQNQLRLNFADVDFLDKNLTARAKAKLNAAMTSSQAREVHTFIQELPPAIHTVLVHCQGGFSRSPGVAAALNAVYGYSIEPERLKEANKSVTQLLIAVAKTNSR
jgi:predicted protein tyrosine phosphatase